MVDTKMLYEVIVSRKMSIAELADAIGINRATLYRKIKRGGATFSIAEAKNIAQVMQLSPEEAQRIFFA